MEQNLKSGNRPTQYSQQTLDEGEKAANRGSRWGQSHWTHPQATNCGPQHKRHGVYQSQFRVDLYIKP